MDLQKKKVKWTKIYHQKFEGYQNEDGDVVYQANENGKCEVVYIDRSGVREKKYIGNSERVANKWLNKIIGGKDV